MELIERKIGETFEFEGKTLQVKESASSDCDGCFFDEQHIPCSKNVAGYCGFKFRTDKKEVIFVEAIEQNQMEQKLNLCEILKHCPEGEQFWSPLLGDVKFHDINQKRNLIVISLESGETWDINADGTISFGTTTSPEIMLYPNKEQRDWSKVKYEPREKKFNPKTLQPFDKVIVKCNDFKWVCEMFSHYDISKGIMPYVCVGGFYNVCIPYNEDTKHLVGTADEAPVFYRYWED